MHGRNSTSDKAASACEQATAAWTLWADLKAFDGSLQAR